MHATACPGILCELTMLWKGAAAVFFIIAGYTGHALAVDSVAVHGATRPGLSNCIY